jgi:hypothetical protein
MRDRWCLKSSRRSSSLQDGPSLLKDDCSTTCGCASQSLPAMRTCAFTFECMLGGCGLECFLSRRGTLGPLWHYDITFMFEVVPTADKYYLSAINTIYLFI